MTQHLKIQRIRRALISVSDKTALLPFAKQLQHFGVEILSTGGTAQLLRKSQIDVQEISDYTGFPEIMDGRVKTLHPKIHGGILGRTPQDDAIMKKHTIPPIDLVVVNLYPFESVSTDPKNSFETIIENIDIGGPTLLRAAAKNFSRVTIVTSPEDYKTVLDEIAQNQGGVSQALRFELAKKAFARIAMYDKTISDFFADQTTATSPSPKNAILPDTLELSLSKKQTLRYGENPHQAAAFYITRSLNPQAGALGQAQQIQGKALSFNNLLDADTALECVKSFSSDTHACVIVKHANPCGIAVHGTQRAAYDRAYQTDPTSAFGGIIAFNHCLEAGTLDAILKQQFVEVIIAPSATDAAVILAQSKPNVRLLVTGVWNPSTKENRLDIKCISGGMLVQESDVILTKHLNDFEVVSQTQPDETIRKDLLFAWQAVKHIKSNAILFAKDNASLGIGAGQMSRIDSVCIAARKASVANLDLTGAVMASDAFFPFRDTVDEAHRHGIKAIIQPGGSIRDAEVIQAADEHGMVMLLTGQRHFRH